MKQGDWIRINFLGRVKVTGEVFDLTREDDAKKHGTYDAKKKYAPVLVILGAGMIMPGVEKVLLTMKNGEKKEFEVKSADALGPRRAELIRILSMAKFIEKNMTPFPGLWLNIDGRNAKVMSVAGGRVKVDFNHPLAGKDLHYEIEMVEDITGAEKRVESLLDYYNIKAKPSVAEGKVKIHAEKDVNIVMKKIVEETLKKWCHGISSVEFTSDSHKKEDAPAKKAAGN